jgi:hypothetical protein
VHDRADWAFEPKLDGWRALFYADDIVTVRTGTGRAASVSLPEPLRGAGRLERLRFDLRRAGR